MMGRMTIVVIEDLTKNNIISKKINTGRAEGPCHLSEYAICKKAAISVAVIHQVLKSRCRQVP